jgi:LPPG:FO 2-phospho-L-lactate transferase
LNKAATTELNIVLLAGGVGGAKLADGLARVVPPERLTIIVNTGDDLRHLGLTICPDLDTVMYTLAGVANPATGWGRAGESWTTMAELGRLGGPAWFRLGDLDLATHLTRTQLLADGRSLTEVTAHLGHHFGVTPTLLPMSDQPAPTALLTDAGVLPFQSWFVGQQWQPAVQKVLLPDDVRASPAVARALESADLVLLAPSNPFVSIDPILSVYPIREMITDLPRAVIGVSPIVGGAALKGPAAKMMAEMGLEVSPSAVAAYYGDLLDIFVYDEQDSGARFDPDLRLLATDTVMTDDSSRARLAREIVNFATELVF